MKIFFTQCNEEVGKINYITENVKPLNGRIIGNPGQKSGEFLTKKRCHAIIVHYIFIKRT